MRSTRQFVNEADATNGSASARLSTKAPRPMRARARRWILASWDR